MQKLRIACTLLFLSFFTITCTKKDHVVPASCKYLGKSYKLLYPTGTGEDYNSSITLDENGLLKEAHSVYIGSFTDVSTNIEHSRNTEDRKYNFTYDNESFLKQQITVRSYLAKTTGTISYGTGFYKEISEITTETIDFSYTSGRIASMSLKSVTIFIGDKQSPIETTVQSKRVYEYDSGGKPLSYIENFSNGDVSVMTYKNGLRASNVVTSGSGFKHTINYNEMALVSEDILPSATYKLSYDIKGNLVNLVSMVNNQATYKQEFKYDDHPNPETIIPSKFKGIPDPVTTIQTSDGNRTNNLIEEIFTSFQNHPGSTQKYIRSYNASGYPEATTMNVNTGQETVARVTTYRYQDCQ
jgi:hypothetical protein